jgi:hypothetical protein
MPFFLSHLLRRWIVEKSGNTRLKGLVGPWNPLLNSYCSPK